MNNKGIIELQHSIESILSDPQIIPVFDFPIEETYSSLIERHRIPEDMLVKPKRIYSVRKLRLPCVS